MTLTDQEAIDLIKANQAAPKWVTDAREYSKTLCALVNGEDFSDELIKNIEKIEAPAKLEVRKKYSRSIKDLYARVFVPIQNVFTSTGGVKDYNNGDVKLTQTQLDQLLAYLSNVRDGKSIEKWIQAKWIDLYHTDPSGIIYLTYTTKPVEGGLEKIYPTYQSINVLQAYLPCGQLTDWLLFIPDDKTIPGKKIWRIIDDIKQRTIIQENTGSEDVQTFTISDDPMQTFDHPFGVVPAIINSDITDKTGKRLPPIFDIEDLSKEYARDQSIKTVYKFLQGFPKHWRRTMFCLECKGTKKTGTEKCIACSGTGLMGNPDVAEVINLPMPKSDEPPLKGEDIMGFSSPDIETWQQFNEELKMEEDLIYKTMWGLESNKMITKTATEIHYDTQPQINKLNKYADQAEWIESTLTEWIANAIDPAKPKDANISLIVYGRRYILEGIDTIQEKYEKAKAAGDNAVILDGIFDELLTVKFKNDPEWLKIECLKANVEPYLHQSLTEVSTIFGPSEAARKIYFARWWMNLTDADLKNNAISLQTKFDDDFKKYLETVIIDNKAPVAATAAAAAAAAAAADPKGAGAAAAEPKPGEPGYVDPAK